ncbi:type II toxin-antitoxin system PemK/MazF family toxin [Blastomonas sp.]|uniref:type II toxin-antitoxin system PemK/MazF family toxin n=1 Tax=Blastomonas sp. TaxID=1909299 RepID=UPI0035931C56
MQPPLLQFDILVIDFPFLDQQRVRLRPVVIISNAHFIAATGIASIAMITRLSAAPWPGDLVVDDPACAGLHKPSKIRMKFHSITIADMIAVGRLGADDQIALKSRFREHLGL